jgi:hypothetical protein
MTYLKQCNIDSQLGNSSRYYRIRGEDVGNVVAEDNQNGTVVDWHWWAWGSKRSYDQIAYLLNAEAKTAKDMATLLARLASIGWLAPSKFPIRFAAALPPLDGTWNRIEEKESKTELTASGTSPRVATIRPQISCWDIRNR